MFGDDPNEARRRAAADATARQIDFFGRRYQLQMADMKKAGLNPILSYRQSPPGVGTQAMAAVENLGLSGAQASASSAQATFAREQARTQADVRNQIRAVTAREMASARNIEADTRLKGVQEILAGTRAGREAVETAIGRHEEGIRRARASSARGAERLYDSEYGEELRMLREFLRIIFGRGAGASD